MKKSKRRALIFSLFSVFILTAPLVSCGTSTNNISGAEIVNGELIITYEDGTSSNLGKVVGKDGVDGKDGIDGSQGIDGKTPEIRINYTTNYWEVSYDGGKTWKSLGVKASSGEGGSFGGDILGVGARLGVDEYGNDVIIYTHYLSGGSEYSVQVKEQSQVTNVQNASYVVNIGEVAPTYYIDVTLDSGGLISLPLVENMITSSNVNYNVVGDYEILGEYKEHPFLVEVKVIDSSDNSIIAGSINHEYVLWDYDSVNHVVIPNYTGLGVNVDRANGVSEFIPITSENLTYTFEQLDRAFEAKANIEGNIFTLNVLPKVISSLQYESPRYYGEYHYIFELNNANLKGNPYLNLTYEEGGHVWEYNEALSLANYVDMHTNTAFDPSVTSSSDYWVTSKYYSGKDTLVRIEAIDFSTYELVNANITYDTVKVTSDGSLPPLTLSLMYRSTVDGQPLNKEEELTPAMVTNLSELDFTTPGKKVIKYTYAGESFVSKIDVYDLNINNVKSINVIGVDQLLLNQGEQLLPLLIKQLTSKDLSLAINYYETKPINPRYIPLTLEMINWQNFDTNIAGNQWLNVTYNGVSTSINVTVLANMSKATLLGAYKMSAALTNIMGPTSDFNVYDNGIVEFEGAYFSYIEDSANNTVTMLVDGMEIIYNINHASKEFAPYTPYEQPSVTYSDASGKPLRLFIYDGYLTLAVHIDLFGMTLPLYTFEDEMINANISEYNILGQDYIFDQTSLKFYEV